MADKKEFSLNLGGGGSSVPMAGGEEFSLMSCTGKSMSFSLEPCTEPKSMGFSLEPCTQASEKAFADGQSAQKRKGRKRRGEEVGEEEPWRAVDSQLILQEGEEGATPGFDEFMVQLRANFAADVKKMFANSPSMMSADLPKPCTPRSDGQDDANKEDEELGGAVVTAPVSG